MHLKKVVILGSTGSIGINALKVIERFPKRFKVVGLTAYSNVKLLERQTKKFSPTHVAVNSAGMKYLRRHVATRKTKILDAKTAIPDIVELPEVDIVVIGICGSAALLPFLSAVRRGKTIAPANKEALVIAGHIIMAEAKKHKALIVPVDSEQSAIFQCLDGQNRSELRKVHLTASGGPLRDVSKAKFGSISVEQILKHPRWKMGKKITVDSATLMNKGLEVIEAKWLFDLEIEDIDVLIHPEAIIHSMVEFHDGSILAQLGITDMRLPIQYALTYPQRLKTTLKRMDFCSLKKLTFDKPDLKKFPALSLCMYAGKRGGTMPCVLNAANEEVVEAFLSHKLHFIKIYDVIEKVVRSHKVSIKPKIEDILRADQWAREEAKRIISRN